jgi:hypothetical protein
VDWASVVVVLGAMVVVVDAAMVVVVVDGQYWQTNRLSALQSASFISHGNLSAFLRARPWATQRLSFVSVLGSSRYHPPYEKTENGVKLPKFWKLVSPASA